MRLPLLGGVVALGVMLVDQSVKAGVLAHSGGSELDSTPLGPFLDLTLRWNRGISFSLFAGDSAAGQAVLLAVTLAATGCWRGGCFVPDPRRPRRALG